MQEVLPMGAPSTEFQPAVKAPQSVDLGKKSERELEFEFGNLDAGGSLLRKALPKSALLPPSFSCSGRWVSKRHL
jgi:hypothetical protein